jgi:anti-anti-sigma factor
MWPASTYHPLVRLRAVPGLFLRPHAWATAERPSSGPGADLPRGGELEITVDVSAGTTTMFIRGQLDLVTMPLLAEQLTRVLAARPARLVLDLTRTGFLDCGSARLIATASQYLPPGQRVVLRRPAPGIRRIFELTRLDVNCDIEG